MSNLNNLCFNGDPGAEFHLDYKPKIKQCSLFEFADVEMPKTREEIKQDRLNRKLEAGLVHPNNNVWSNEKERQQIMDRFNKWLKES